MEELTDISVTITKDDFKYLLEHFRGAGIIEHIVILTTQRSEEAQKMFEEKWGK